MSSTPLGAGSVSLRLYPHLDLPAPRIVDVLREQARRAAERGFDGVMVSEHHGGFAGYLPNPTQTCGFLLAAMPSGWAAPSPLLLPLRPPGLVIEEIAWLAAAYPGRVGVGVAAGSLEQDFTVFGLTKDDLTRRFADGLDAVATALRGGPLPAALDVLAGDPAVAACAAAPVPVVSAVGSMTAMRRAARCGVGVLLDSLAAPERCTELIAAYREAGGTGPAILIRRAWVGEGVGARQARQEDVYRGYAAGSAQAHWGQNEIIGGDAGQVADGLLAVLAGTGADALNLRIHVPGVTPDEIAAQTDALGGVVARMRAAGWGAG